MNAEDTPKLLQKQKPSRRKIEPGDVFSIQIPDGFLLGRVVATDAKSSVWDEPRWNLLYIYAGIRETVDFDPEDFRPPSLLIPPLITNRLGWSHGYFETVGKAPLEDADRLQQHVFERPGSNDFWDEHANPVPVSELPDHKLIGIFGLHSYLSIEDAISQALGMDFTSG